MPPRKEPKEAVVYPASKRKGPAFKPQRPTKTPRVSSTEAESSKPKPVAKKTTSQAPSRAQNSDDDDEESDDADSNPANAGAQQDNDDDSDEDLADDPLSASRPKKLKAPARPKTTSNTTEPPSRALPDEANDLLASSPPPPPFPSQSTPSQIPQPLLLRLLHEHFADKQTKIDKHAIVVLQKYVEVFVREAIARTAEGKKEREGVRVEDVGWLELEDLEVVAGGLMLDF